MLVLKIDRYSDIKHKDFLFYTKYLKSTNQQKQIVRSCIGSILFSYFTSITSMH